MLVIGIVLLLALISLYVLLIAIALSGIADGLDRGQFSTPVPGSRFR